MARPHLFVAVSSHGYGHFAQTAPVLNALWRHLPELRVTLRTGLPRAFVAARLTQDFDWIEGSADFGMEMASAFEVRYEDSARRYREFHSDWAGRVAAEAALIRRLAPAVVLANIPYLTLAGAAAAGVPALALCSLNWAEIYAHYFAHRPEAQTILADMRAAYAAAACFLQPTPSMPMPGLPCVRSVGPIATLGRSRRAALDAALGLHGDERLVLIATGGIETRLAIERWPRRAGHVWLVPSQWGVERADVRNHDILGLAFTDLLCSCDVLVTKPGYGSFVEAACNGIPVLYARRGDWPEEPCLVEWINRVGVAGEISRRELERGQLVMALDTVLARAIPPPPGAAGAEQAALAILAYLT